MELTNDKDWCPNHTKEYILGGLKGGAIPYLLDTVDNSGLVCYKCHKLFTWEEIEEIAEVKIEIGENIFGNRRVD